MKNSQILELARKQAGIADGVRTETFAAWKRAGMSVRKGEKAAFTAKINCKYNGSWCMTEKAYFTADQVEPITAKPSRREKDTAPVSESAPAVAVPSVEPSTEPAPAPVVELAPVVPVVAPSNPTRPLIKAGDDKNGTYFGVASDGTLVTIATYETHDLTIERVEPSVSVQTEPAPAVVDAPADPDPVEEPAPVETVEEEDKPELPPCSVLPVHLSDAIESSDENYIISDFKLNDIRRWMRGYACMWNDLRQARLDNLQHTSTLAGVALQSEKTWNKLGYKIKADAGRALASDAEVYFILKNGKNELANPFTEPRTIVGLKAVRTDFYAWDQVERA